MSRNMGKRTNPDHGHGIDRIGFESPGLLVRRLCPACGKPKHSGQSHPKCSRILQQRSQRGEVI